MTMVLVEAAVDTIESARVAAAAGVDRLELCARLDLGGLTPTAELLREIAVLGLPAFVMIRPRPGGFCYDGREADEMLVAIESARAAGAAGIVTGALTTAGTLDRELTARLLRAAGELPVTFHRAFDQITDPMPALLELGRLGARRILTSGGESTAYRGRAAIRHLRAASPTGLTIVAGGGVVAEEVLALIGETGVTEIHLAAVRQLPSARPNGPPRSVPNPDRLRAVLGALGR